MSAESALKRLIQSPEPRAIALVGTWGRGKTHLWNHLVSTTEKHARSKYSYVSLFGINDPDDLKLAIFQKEIDAGQPQTLTRWQKLKNRLPWRSLAESATEIENPWVGNLNKLYRTAAFSLVRDRLICFDDFERRGKDLDLEQVLGLITFLCEERRCSVVLILNDSTLTDVANWNKYREKVFHSEVTYRPSTETCLDIILGSDGSDPWLAGARNVLSQLDVSNMRIMARIKDALLPLQDRYASVSAHTKWQMGATLALYSFCHNAAGEGAPPIERALKNPYHRFVSAASADVRTDEEKRWDALLSKIDFYPDELDAIIVNYVKDGYPDLGALDTQVGRMEAALVENSADQAFSDAWDTYHNTFADNAEEVIAKFRSAFPAAAPKMNAMNANSTIALMRRLGEEDLADSFISNWIDARRGERRAELSLREAQVFGPLTDQRFMEALVQAEREETTDPDFAQAMETIAKGHGGVTEALRTVSLADPASVQQWFEANAGRVSRTFITTSMQHPGEEAARAQAVIREALQRMSATSRINEIRVGNLLRAIDDP